MGGVGNGYDCKQCGSSVWVDVEFEVPWHELCCACASERMADMRDCITRELKSMKRERAEVSHICDPFPDCKYNACRRIMRLEIVLGA